VTTTAGITANRSARAPLTRRGREFTQWMDFIHCMNDK
jgi:hypothetical protein